METGCELGPPLELPADLANSVVPWFPGFLEAGEEKGFSLAACCRAFPRKDLPSTGLPLPCATCSCAVALATVCGDVWPPRDAGWRLLIPQEAAKRDSVITQPQVVVLSRPPLSFFGLLLPVASIFQVSSVRR